MNIYVVVEGKRTEPAVYKSWIPCVNPNLRHIDNIADFADNNYLLVAGHGYPGYFDRIRNAIEDVNNSRDVQRLVIAVDSEDMSFEDKFDEISRYVSGYPCSAEIKIVVQHFCFETWALGNKKLIGKNIQAQRLREYRAFFNVTQEDPELLPAYPKDGISRVAFALKYLNVAFQEKHNSLSYSKRKPNALCNEPYFVEVKKRLQLTNHIRSFQTFLDAFCLRPEL